MEEEVQETNLSLPFIIEAIGIGLSMIQLVYSFAITNSLQVLAKRAPEFNYSREVNPIYPLGEFELTPVHAVMVIEKVFMIISMVAIVTCGLHATILLKNRLIYCHHFLNCIPLIFSITNFASAGFYILTSYMDILKHQMYSQLEETYPNLVIYRACIYKLKDAHDKAEALVLGPVLEEQKRTLETIGMCPPALDRNVTTILSEIIGVLFMIAFFLGVDLNRWPYTLFWCQNELGGIETEILLEEQRRANEREAAALNEVEVDQVAGEEVVDRHDENENETEEENERPRPRPRRLEDIDFEERLPPDALDNPVFRAIDL